MSAESIGQVFGFVLSPFLFSTIILFIYGIFKGKRQITWKRVIIGGFIILGLSILGKIVPKT